MAVLEVPEEEVAVGWRVDLNMSVVQVSAMSKYKGICQIRTLRASLTAASVRPVNRVCSRRPAFCAVVGPGTLVTMKVV